MIRAALAWGRDSAEADEDERIGFARAAPRRADVPSVTGSFARSDDGRDPELLGSRGERLRGYQRGRSDDISFA